MEAVVASNDQKNDVSDKSGYCFFFSRFIYDDVTVETVDYLYAACVGVIVVPRAK